MLCSHYNSALHYSKSDDIAARITMLPCGDLNEMYILYMLNKVTKNEWAKLAPARTLKQSFFSLQVV